MSLSQKWINLKIGPIVKVAPATFGGGGGDRKSLKVSIDMPIQQLRTRDAKVDQWILSCNVVKVDDWNLSCRATEEATFTKVVGMRGTFCRVVRGLGFGVWGLWLIASA